MKISGTPSWGTPVMRDDSRASTNLRNLRNQYLDRAVNACVSKISGMWESARVSIQGVEKANDDVSSNLFLDPLESCTPT
jgi:hypothetical protein